MVRFGSVSIVVSFNALYNVSVIGIIEEEAHVVLRETKRLQQTRQ